MKKLPKLLFLAFLLAANTNAQAQLPGLLKKAKDKVSQGSSSKQSPAENTEKEQTNEVDKTNPSQIDGAKPNEIKWEKISFNSAVGGETFNPNAWPKSTSSFIKLDNTDKYDRQSILSPFSVVRKIGEKGMFHFAKDYPELVNYTFPYNPGATIEFSSTPFTNGNAVKETHFNSSGHIYANLKSLSGNLNDALKLAGDETKFAVIIKLFDNDVIKACQYQANFTITSKNALKNNLLIDILPQVENATVLESSTGIGIFETPFPEMHKQSNFPKTGAYKVGVFLSYKLKDDWRKETNEEKEIADFFDYDFDIKDAVRITEEGKNANNRIRKINFDKDILNKPLPVEWNKLSSAITTGYTQQAIIDWALGNKKNIKLLKFYASPNPSGFYIMNNEFGIPDRKWSNQKYSIFYKDLSTNQCYYVQGAQLFMKYAGGGTWDKNVYLAYTESQLADCEKMK